MNTYIFIHGGESFNTKNDYLEWIQTTGVDWNLSPISVSEGKKKWKNELAKKLTENGNLVYMPNFPNPQNAKYEEWKLFFEAWIAKIEIQGNIILLGNSLGGCFIIKYFSEFPVIARTPLCEALEVPLGCEAIQKPGLPQKIAREQQFFSQGQVHNIHQVHVIAACLECGDFTLPTNYQFLQEMGDRVHIWHAKDDDIEPFATTKEIKKKLNDSVTHFFGPEKGYGHFHTISDFPELTKELFKKL